MRKLRVLAGAGVDQELREQAQQRRLGDQTLRGRHSEELRSADFANCRDPALHFAYLCCNAGSTLWIYKVAACRSPRPTLETGTALKTAVRGASPEHSRCRRGLTTRHRATKRMQTRRLKGIPHGQQHVVCTRPCPWLSENQTLSSTLTPELQARLRNKKLTLAPLWKMR